MQLENWRVREFVSFKTDNEVDGLPPSLKLRRTAEALAEAGQTAERSRV